MSPPFFQSLQEKFRYTVLNQATATSFEFIIHCLQLLDSNRILLTASLNYKQASVYRKHSTLQTKRIISIQSTHIYGGAQVSSTKSSWRWCLITLGPQNGTFFTSPFYFLEYGHPVAYIYSHVHIYYKESSFGIASSYRTESPGLKPR